MTAEERRERAESPRGGTTRRRVETLLVGVSVRPFARSAVRAGVDALSVDWFGDRDHRLDLPVLSLRRDAGAEECSAAALVELARGVDAREAAYVADLENHPAAVRRLRDSGERGLLGNPPDVLRPARDPFRVTEAVRSAELPAPEVRPPDDPPARYGDRGWLRKPLRGGGGQRIRPWPAEEDGDADVYLQERIPGTPVGALFVADGRGARLLGLTEMLVGRETFGGGGFLYGGSLLRLGPAGRPLPPPGPAADETVGRARRLAEVLAGELGLRGLNGVDAILRDGELWPVELNPRWTSSMELLEAGARPGDGRLPRPLFDLHRAGCAGRLPPKEALPGGGPADAPGRPRRVVGKAVVRSRREARAPDLPAATGLARVPSVRGGPPEAWAGPVVTADVPEPGDPLRRGHPVCTLLAAAPDADGCLRRLEDGAARVHRAVAAAGGPDPERRADA